MGYCEHADSGCEICRTEAGARRLEAAIPLWRKAHAKLEKRLSPDLARRLADEALIGDGN